MGRHWAYLRYVLRHKWFVFVAGWRLGIPWLALLHDNSKFRPDEWGPYAAFFYEPDGTKRTRRDSTGYYKPTDTGDAAFDFAWLLHQKRNKHHWQWWLEVPTDYHRCMVSSTGTQSESSRCAPTSIGTAPSYVSHADSSVHSQTSPTQQASTDRSATSTGRPTVPSNERNVETFSEPMIGRDTSVTQRQPGHERGPLGYVGDGPSFRRTAGPIRLAPAAESLPSNSLSSITSTAGENSTATNSRPMAPPSTDGSLSKASRMATGSSATTATAPSGTTATVRIGLLDIVPFDDGGAKCMRCGERLPEDEGGVKVLPMPDRYRREMLADWRGAGLAQGIPDTLRWYTANRRKMNLHPETRAWIEAQLGYQEVVA